MTDGEDEAGKSLARAAWCARSEARVADLVEDRALDSHVRELDFRLGDSGGLLRLSVTTTEEGWELAGVIDDAGRPEIHLCRPDGTIDLIPLDPHRAAAVIDLRDSGPLSVVVGPAESPDRWQTDWFIVS